jgi:hypothetical protein
MISQPRKSGIGSYTDNSSLWWKEKKIFEHISIQAIVDIYFSQVDKAKLSRSLSKDRY